MSRRGDARALRRELAIGAGALVVGGTGVALVASAMRARITDPIALVGLPEAPLTVYAGDARDGVLFIDDNGMQRNARQPSGPRIVTQKTAIRPNSQFCGVVVFILTAYFGFSTETATLFGAHLARETGFGGSCWNWCWGNVKAYNVWASGPWWRFGTASYATHTPNPLPPSHSANLAQPYVARATPVEGMAVAVYSVQHGFPAAWALLQAGDSSWYGVLGASGYYEGTPSEAQAEYNQILGSFRRSLAAYVPPASASAPGLSTGGGIAAILAVIAATAAGAYGVARLTA